MKKLLLLIMDLFMMLPSSAMAQESTTNRENLENSITVLEDFGVNLEDRIQTPSFRSQSVGEKEIYFNGGLYALPDKDNRIIKIDRIEETNEDTLRKKAIKKDYRITQSLVEDRLIKDGYELVQSGYFDDTTLNLRYEKIMSYGGHDQYDAYEVYIDIDNGALVSD